MVSHKCPGGEGEEAEGEGGEGEEKPLLPLPPGWILRMMPMAQVEAFTAHTFFSQENVMSVNTWWREVT